MAEITPKKKPYTEAAFKNDADRFIKGYLGGFDKGEMNNLLKNSINKIQASGVMSSDEARDFIKDRADYLKEFSKENPNETLPELKANGGRIGFLKGGDTKYNSMVFRMYTEAGGQEGTGMDIDTFAEKYFPKMAQGGRIGFQEGSMDPDTMALKEKIEEIMDIEGVDFGVAFKQAMRELKSQSKE